MSSPAKNWDDLTELWRSDASELKLPPLQRLAATDRRRLVLLEAGEMALIGVFAILSAIALARGLEPWSLVWLVTLWFFTAVAVLFAQWNRNLAWYALSETVESYLGLARIRAERRIWAARFGIVLLAFEVVAVVAQLIWFDRFSVTAGVLLGALVIVLTAWCAHSARQARRELALLESYDNTL